MKARKIGELEQSLAEEEQRVKELRGGLESAEARVREVETRLNEAQAEAAAQMGALKGERDSQAQRSSQEAAALEAARSEKDGKAQGRSPGGGGNKGALFHTGEDTRVGPHLKEHPP